MIILTESIILIILIFSVCYMMQKHRLERSRLEQNYKIRQLNKSVVQKNINHDITNTISSLELHIISSNNPSELIDSHIKKLKSLLKKSNNEFLTTESTITFNLKEFINDLSSSIFAQIHSKPDENVSIYGKPKMILTAINHLINESKIHSKANKIDMDFQGKSLEITLHCRNDINPINNQDLKYISNLLQESYVSLHQKISENKLTYYIQFNQIFYS